MSYLTGLIICYFIAFVVFALVTYFTPAEQKESLKTNIVNSKEDAALNATVELWELFLQLENKHPDMETEFRHGLHRLQDMIIAKKYLDEQNIKR